MSAPRRSNFLSRILFARLPRSVTLLPLLPLLPLGLALACGPAAAGTAPPPSAKTAAAAKAAAVAAKTAALAAAKAARATPGAPLSGVVTLSPKLLLQLVISRSAEVNYSRAQIEVAGQLSAAEAALYEVVAYSTLRRDGGPRQRTIEERIASVSTSSQTILYEQVKNAEAGVRTRLPSGADLSLSYKLRQRSNNIIASAATSDTEYDAALVVGFRQPLLKGRGRDVVETDLRVARGEHRIAMLQYEQQLLKSGTDALAVYWQLYRALEVQRIRDAALDYAHRVAADTGARIDAGKLASSNRIEAQAAVLLREVEQIRAVQGVREAESRLETLLNISGLAEHQLSLVVRPGTPDFSAVELGTAAQRYEQALTRWPALEIARMRREQAGVRLDFARNQSLPTLDLVLSRTNTGLSNDNHTARELTEQSRYPAWSIGLNLEIPLEGNQKARSQYRAQGARVHQAEIEIESIRTALANDVRMRWDQASGGAQEVTRMDTDVALRTELLRIEQVRYDAGLGQLSQLLQRETELTDSRQRLVESNARLGQANDALLSADGSLLAHYDITLKD